MSDILHARTMSFNCVRAMKFGYKPTAVERAIMLRSDHTHMEFQFSTRYGGISFSSTLRDDVKGCRFKMIKYSHPEYWDAVYIPVTAEQEEVMFGKACRMADSNLLFNRGKYPEITECEYGKDHVKYDFSGAAFSYWTKFKIWKPSKTKMVCNRACTEVVLAGHPKAMSIPMKYWQGRMKQADFASMTPSECDAMFRHYFRDNH